MLETVKQLINKSPFISFEQHFTQYVMDVQDANIDAEVTFLLRNNSVTCLLLNKVINQQLGGYK